MRQHLEYLCHLTLREHNVDLQQRHAQRRTRRYLLFDTFARKEARLLDIALKDITSETAMARRSSGREGT